MGQPNVKCSMDTPKLREDTRSIPAAVSGDQAAAPAAGEDLGAGSGGEATLAGVSGDRQRCPVDSHLVGGLKTEKSTM
eukprot:365492-Chlamydomonas_euryale.AAC.3